MADNERLIDRRRFIHTSAAGGAWLVGLACGGSACGPRSQSETSQAAQAPTGAPAIPGTGFELEEATIADLGQRLESGKDTAESLVEKYLNRIELFDRNGPMLQSIIEINPDARAIAAALDAERKAKGPRGPLHGIPILVKDNIDTADKMTTTAGSLALEGSIAPRDSTVAARLREAGAVLLAKTNLSEWANFRSTKSTSGWSGRGGQCRNPYALDRNPSGSSSGSGAAIAANFAAAAIGTETDGSIVSPASYNSLVGIKPTLGLVSRAGIIPIAHSQDTAGPMARSVADAALLLGALVGVDERDPVSAQGVRFGQRDYSAALDRDGLKGARLGVVRARLFGNNAKVDRALETAIEDLKKLGAVIVDPADIPTLGKFDDNEFQVLLYEFKADLEAYLATLGPEAKVKSLADIIAFNERERAREMPFFGQEIMEQAVKKGPLGSREYRDALAASQRMARQDGIDAVMNKHRLDALVCPTGSLPGLTDLVNGDSGYFGASTAPAVAGYPHLTLPAGYVFGLPVGLSFIGRPWSEASLIKYAYAYEQATRHRKAPMFLPTAELTS